MEETMRNQKRTTRLAVLVLALTILVSGFTLAYFTDTDSITNTFEFGKITIEGTEPEWDPVNPPEDILPNEEFKKDPTITNTGDNPAYVFIEVEVPCANIATVNLDGTKNAAADTELFQYTVNPGWVEVGTATCDGDSHTHVYAYGTDAAMTELGLGAKATVFNAVRATNVVESDALMGSTKDIVVNYYAIQTTVLNNGDTVNDGTANAGKTAPADVWAVVVNQTK